MRSRTKFPKQKAAADKRAGHISFPHAPIKWQTRGKKTLCPVRSSRRPPALRELRAHAPIRKRQTRGKKCFAPCAHQGALPLCGSCVRTLQSNGKREETSALPRASHQGALPLSGSCVRTLQLNGKREETPALPRASHQGALPLSGNCVRTLQSNGKREEKNALPRAPIKAHSRFAGVACARSNQTANARKTRFAPCVPSRRTPALRELRAHAPIKRQTRGNPRFAPCAHQGALPLCGSCVRTLQ